MSPQARLPLFALLACGFLASCKSKDPELPGDPMARPADEQESAYIPTYSRTVLAGWPKGRSMDPYDSSRVRLPEEVHAYHVGRLPSKDRREMHEAHTVYRVEQDAAWDTRLPATPMDSRGVVLGIVDPARKEVPDDAVIDQERQALVAKSLAMRKAMGELDVLRANLLKKKREFEQTEQDRIDIKAYLDNAIAERNDFEEKLKQAQARIQELDEQNQLRSMSSGQGFPLKKK